VAFLSLPPRSSDFEKVLRIARRVLGDRGFLVDFPDGALEEAEHAKARRAEHAKDLRELPWSSIDNRESKDLDQIEWMESLGGGRVRVLVGIADVDSFAGAGSQVDAFAGANTSSLYAGPLVFPMLPEVLSTDRTSLLFDVERLAFITEYVVDASGRVSAEDVYHAVVRNRAQLVYDDVGAWLEEQRGAPSPPAGFEAQLRLQDEVAACVRARRVEEGALGFDTVEARTITMPDGNLELTVVKKNRARELVEDLMIAANGATARFLDRKGFPSIRRMVKTPKRWSRIIELAAANGTKLPAEPDPKALSTFLAARKEADPTRFRDLSLSVVKLLGPGEYQIAVPNVPHEGHFGLAVQDYTHSTAPNRRYADLVTQRLLRASSDGKPLPYALEALKTIAQRCTDKENDARAVERTMRKVLAAIALSDHIGQVFDGVVTGVADKGTFVRLTDPPAEGRIVRGEEKLDVGDKVRVELLATAPDKGFLDFARV
jgi:exoribonuclease-2